MAEEAAAAALWKGAAETAVTTVQPVSVSEASVAERAATIRAEAAGADVPAERTQELAKSEATERTTAVPRGQLATVMAVIVVVETAGSAEETATAETASVAMPPMGKLGMVATALTARAMPGA